MQTELQKMLEAEKIKVRQEAQRKLAEEHQHSWNMAVEACIALIPEWIGNDPNNPWDSGYIACRETILLALEGLKKHE